MMDYADLTMHCALILACSRMPIRTDKVLFMGKWVKIPIHRMFLSEMRVREAQRLSFSFNLSKIKVSNDP